MKTAWHFACELEEQGLHECARRVRARLAHEEGLVV